MKKFIFVCFAIVCFSISIFAQKIPTATLVSIVKAEDERRFDKTLEALLKNRDAKVRTRAALAIGRIGDERGVSFLIDLLETDLSDETRTMAMFALGEIESIKAADAVLNILAKTSSNDSIRSRAVEAAGKIASANAKDAKSKSLGEAILNALEYENGRRSQSNTDAIRFGLTAILRVRPEKGDFVTAKFLTALDPKIRADAANALSRLRAKNANEQLRAMLLSDDDATARANAARALGSAEDQTAFDLMLEKALTDADSRVRVSAIRSLGSLKDKRAADKLIERGNALLIDFKRSKSANPSEKSELLEIATTLGRLLPNSDDEKAIEFLKQFRTADQISSPETEIAFARIAPEVYLNSKQFGETSSQLVTWTYGKLWKTISSLAQGLGTIAESSDTVIKSDRREEIAEKLLEMMCGQEMSSGYVCGLPSPKVEPDILRAFASFKTDKLSEALTKKLRQKNDVFVRATAAELLGEQTVTKEVIEALKIALVEALKTDKDSNDAQLAILSALVKLDKKESFESLQLALNAPDYLLRKHAANLIKENDLTKDFSNVEKMVGTIKPYNPKNGTKLGQILNTNADYTRAVSRKNARAILTTEKGVFTIEFAPEDAPLTVDNFIKLAKAKYFNGLAIHRVVPNFVMQDGDPRGDGNGGPGWQIRCELNMLAFERGAVGMALSGKDTGGSQWFITHSAQPHLDGGYTVFGKVSETDMKVVDNLVRGDKILTVKIVEGFQTKKKSAKK